MAGVAFVVTGDADFAFFTSSSFFERDLHGVAEVVATEYLAATPLLPAGLSKDVAKNIAKGKMSAAYWANKVKW